MFAIVRSVFGDYWVGKTTMTPGPGIYDDWEDAKFEAIVMADVNGSDYNLIELNDSMEEDAEEIEAEVEKFIVGR